MPEPDAPDRVPNETGSIACPVAGPSRNGSIEQLSATIRELEQFAYTISHDLQAPLRSILGFSQLLSRRHKDQLSGEALEFLGYIEQSAQQAQAQIQDLLRLSRVGRGERHVETRSLEDTLRNVLKHLNERVQESSAVIDYDPLPRICTDHGLLAQLLQQLIDNAIKFHRPGEAPRVKIQVTAENSGWRISVADNGIGIPADQLDNVFIVFRRLHAADKYPGTGMGLTIARKIALLLGGSLHATSDGNGSEFILQLPADVK